MYNPPEQLFNEPSTPLFVGVMKGCHGLFKYELYSVKGAWGFGLTVYDESVRTLSVTWINISERGDQTLPYIMGDYSCFELGPNFYPINNSCNIFDNYEHFSTFKFKIYYFIDQEIHIRKI